jgi:hypothetical protein
MALSHLGAAGHSLYGRSAPSQFLSPLRARGLEPAPSSAIPDVAHRASRLCSAKGDGTPPPSVGAVSFWNCEGVQPPSAYFWNLSLRPASTSIATIARKLATATVKIMCCVPNKSHAKHISQPRSQDCRLCGVATKKTPRPCARSLSNCRGPSLDRRKPEPNRERLVGNLSPLQFHPSDGVTRASLLVVHH